MHATHASIYTHPIPAAVSAVAAVAGGVAETAAAPVAGIPLVTIATTTATAISDSNKALFRGALGFGEATALVGPDGPTGRFSGLKEAMAEHH